MARKSPGNTAACMQHAFSVVSKPSLRVIRVSIMPIDRISTKLTRHGERSELVTALRDVGESDISKTSASAGPTAPVRTDSVGVNV